MYKLLSLFALLALSVPAQTPRTLPTAAQARQLEASLQTNPGNRAARSALLDYYFRTSNINPAEAIPARRNHILWLIQNTPADPLAGSPGATIDAAGHRLADPQGFQLASTAWKEQTAKTDAATMTLANAAYFFKLSDMGFAQVLLERAVALDPANAETGARLGDLYAMSILGITKVNASTFPLAADTALTRSPLAQRSREALNNSRNPYVVAKAGYMLSFQGLILRSMGKLAFDASSLAESSLQRAVALAPGDAGVAALLQQHRQLQQSAKNARDR